MGAFIPVDSNTSVGYYQIGEVVLDRDNFTFNYITKSGQSYRVQCADKAEFDARLDDLVSFGVSPSSVKALSDGKVSADGVSVRGYLLDVLDLGIAAEVKNGKMLINLRKFYNPDITEEPTKTGAVVFGKPEYSLGLKVAGLPNSGEKVVLLNLPADVFVTSISGIAYNSALDVTIPLPYSSKVELYHSGSSNTKRPRTLTITTSEDYSGFDAYLQIKYTRSE